MNSIFCVTKLDWQFIGDIRLRGVTPRLCVPSDRQKSISLLPALPLTRYSPVSCPPYRPHLHAGCKFRRARQGWNISSPNNDSVPAANAFHWHCLLFDVVARRLGTERNQHPRFLSSFFPRRVVPVDIWISSCRLNLQLFPLPISEIRYRASRWETCAPGGSQDFCFTEI